MRSADGPTPPVRCRRRHGGPGGVRALRRGGLVRDDRVGDPGTRTGRIVDDVTGGFSAFVERLTHLVLLDRGSRQADAGEQCEAGEHGTTDEQRVAGSGHR